MYLATFVLLSAMFGAALPDSLEFSECNLPNGKVGECRLSHNCPEVIKYIKQQNRFGLVSKRVLPERCGFSDHIAVVCCDKDAVVTPEVRGFSKYYYNKKYPYDGQIVFEEDNSYYHPRSTKRPVKRIKPTAETTTAIPEIPYVFNDEERKSVTVCKTLREQKGSSVENHILGGELVKQGDLPHMAALGYMLDTGLSFDCGGTLISERYVLTAAHCVNTNSNIKPTMVRLGTTKLNGTFDTSDTDYEVEDIVHPEYNRLKKHNDIALLRLKRAVILSHSIYPACLETEPENPQEGMYIAGWGIVENGQRSPDLLKAEVASVTAEVCTVAFNSASSFRTHNPNGILPSQICAKDVNNVTDTCAGDSGGPLLLAINEVESMYKVVGITSYGKRCGTNSPGIYTRVSSFIEWIEGNVWP